MSEKKPKAQLDWGNLKFEYEDVNCYMKCVWKDGAWGALESVEGSPYITMHVGATALHYGQALFEGLKAFACKDGKVSFFLSFFFHVQFRSILGRNSIFLHTFFLDPCLPPRGKRPPDGIVLSPDLNANCPHRSLCQRSSFCGEE